VFLAPSDIEKIAIVLPVYNDWESLAILAGELGSIIDPNLFDVEIFAIDDGSEGDGDDILAARLHNGRVPLKVVRLTCNLGHQRAIAVGVALVEELGHDAVIVMDSDGEDNPKDLPALLDAHQAHPEAIIVAQRAERSEGSVFRVGYPIFCRPDSTERSPPKSASDRRSTSQVPAR
jgi:glycosyltransferase involved in cell wall biosynthesis